MAMSAKAARVGRSSGPGVPEQCSRTCQDELAFQCLFRQPLALSPISTGNGCIVQVGVTGLLTPKQGGEVSQLGDSFGGWAASALSSVSSGLLVLVLPSAEPVVSWTPSGGTVSPLLFPGLGFGGASGS